MKPQIWNLKPEIWNLKAETWNLKSKISETWNPKSEIWIVISKIPETWNLKFEIWAWAFCSLPHSGPLAHRTCWIKLRAHTEASWIAEVPSIPEYGGTKLNQRFCTKVESSFGGQQFFQRPQNASNRLPACTRPPAPVPTCLPAQFRNHPPILSRPHLPP